MLSLLKIKNLENETFFKEALSINESVKNLKHDKIKTYGMRFLCALPLFLIIESILLSIDFKEGVPVNLDLSITQLLFVAFVSMVVNGCFVMVSDYFVKLAIYNKNKLKLMNKLKINKKNNKLFYNKKELKEIENKLKNLNEDVLHLFKLNIKIETKNISEIKRTLLLERIKSLEIIEFKKEQERILSLTSKLSEKDKIIVYKEIETKLILTKLESDKLLYNINQLSNKKEKFGIKNENAIIKNI